jgi:hypothetical protein
VQRSLATLWKRFASSADGTKLVAAFGYDYLIRTSADSGATWSGNLIQTYGATSLVSSADGSTLVAAAATLFYVSTNYGAGWTMRSLANGKAKVSMSADATKLLAASDYLYTSTDLGLTWSPPRGPAGQTWASTASSADGTKLVAVAGGMDSSGYVYSSSGPAP